MTIVEVGDIWYANFLHYDLKNSFKHRTVLIMDKLKGGVYLALEVTSDKIYNEGPNSIRLNKEKFNLKKESFVDVGTWSYVYHDNLKNKRCNINSIDPNLWNKILQKAEDIQKRYSEDPWLFKTWCIRNRLHDCTYDIEDFDTHPIKNLEEIHNTKQATDVDVALSVYEICNSNKKKKFKARYLIIKLCIEDDTIYSMCCSFYYKSSRYAFVMYDGLFEIIGPFETFERLNIEVASQLRQTIMNEPEKTKAYIYNIYRDKRIDAIHKLIKKSKSSMTRGLVIDLMIESEDYKELNEAKTILDTEGEIQYLIKENISMINLI